MAGMFCPGLKRGYVLPSCQMSLAGNKIILIHQTVIMV